MLIGEVARRSGVSARMLRHYESLGLVRPTGRSGNGYREYSGDDIRRIFHVESLRSLGLSLRDVGRALEDPGFTPSELVDDLILRTRERIESETELLTRLRRIGAAEPADWQDVLQTVTLLHALGSTSAGTRQRAALSSVDEVPVEALVEAVLGERTRTSPEPFGGLWRNRATGGRSCWRRGSRLPRPRSGNVPSGRSPGFRAAGRPTCWETPSPTPMSWSAGTPRWSSGRAESPMPSRPSSTWSPRRRTTQTRPTC